MKLPYEKIIKMNNLLEGISPMFRNSIELENLFKCVDEIEVLEEKEDTKKLVLEWAKERDLLHYENHTKQYIKLVEEVGELGRALLKKDYTNTIDALGDIQVVLIILASQLSFVLEDCLDSAYNEIKNRKGNTINGSFHKD